MEGKYTYCIEKKHLVLYIEASVSLKKINWTKIVTIMLESCRKDIQGNQDSSGNHRNVIQGQRPDIENSHIQQGA